MFIIAEPLPMNITRFTPAPTLPSPTPSSDCFDTISDCRKYTKAACSDYKPWARAHCSAYCGFCDCKYHLLNMYIVPVLSSTGISLIYFCNRPLKPKTHVCL